MIDTIHFRLHDISLHLPLEQNLRRPRGIVQKSKRVAVPVSKMIVEGEEFVVYPVSYLVFQDTLKSVEHSYKSFDKLGSYHYTMAYKIDYENNHIDFNLSIPKYLYGTNVLQYLTNSPAINFIYTFHKTIETNINESYRYLLTFIKRFFDREFTSYQVFLENIEIRRIDICFNQLHPTKEDALKFLEYQSKIKKPFEREHRPNYDGGTISIVHKDYSFKIYHKGLEFEKHDARELRKIGISPKRLKLLQNLADKTLRYELTVRPSYMSYLWLQTIKEKTTVGKNKTQYYNNLQNRLDAYNLKIQRSGKVSKPIYQSRKRAVLNKKVSLMNNDKLDLIKFYETSSVDYAQKLDKYQLQSLNNYNKLFARTYQFFPFDYFDNRKQFIRYLNHDVNELINFIDLKKQNFSSLLLNTIQNRFFNLFNHFQVKNLVPINSIQEKVIKYNAVKNELNKSVEKLFPEFVKKPKRLNDVNKFLFLLFQNNMDYRLLENQKIYSRTQIWRYRNFLKELGVDTNYSANLHYTPSQDYSDYHDYTMFNREIF